LQMNVQIIKHKPQICLVLKKYVRVSREQEAYDVLFITILPTWNLKWPELLISVDAGENDLRIPYKLREAFLWGLVKTTRTKKSWIITNGRSTGISNLIGEAIDNEFISLSENAPAVIGINKHQDQGDLDSKHSYFILLDEDHDDVIGFRSEFERAALCEFITCKKPNIKQGLLDFVLKSCSFGNVNSFVIQSSGDTKRRFWHP
jgi:hypothetical protein